MVGDPCHQIKERLTAINYVSNVQTKYITYRAHLLVHCTICHRRTHVLCAGPEFDDANARKIKSMYEEKANKMLEQVEDRDKQITELHRQFVLSKEMQSELPLSARTKRKRIDPGEISDVESEKFWDAESFFGFSAPDPEAMKKIVDAQIQPLIDQIKIIAAKQDQILKLIQSVTSNNKQVGVQPNSTSPAIASTIKSTQFAVPEKIKVMSFAEALSKATLKPQCIRNINIMGDKEQTNRVYQQLRKDDMLADIPSASIKTKGPANITLKCTSAENADIIAKKLNDEYGEAINIKTVQKQKPMIKVPKLFTDETSKELILAQLVDQNPILQGMPIEIDQFYQTTTYKDEKYWCMILATDLPSQTKILQRGILHFNIAEIKIYEYVNILQCENCLRYGHFARTCTFAPCCKKCTLNHKTTQCIATTVKPKMKCINCITANNTNNNNYGTEHRPTDERCSSRQERINALKILHLAKN